MHLIVGLALALAVLYYWLEAHWFARVVMFFAFAAFGVLVGCLVNSGPGDGSGVPVMVLGIVLAWPVSGIPIYCDRYKNRSVSLALRE